MFPATVRLPFPMTPFLLKLLDQAAGGSEDAVRQFSHLSIPVFPSLSSLHCRVFRPQLHSGGSCTQGKGDHVDRMGPLRITLPSHRSARR